MSTPTGWTRAATRMGAITAVSRSFGFVRVLVVAAVLGTTYLGNAFQAANSLSNVLFELLAAGALSAVLVPTFVRLCDDGNDASIDRLASGLLWVAGVVLGVATLVGVVGAPFLARVLAAGVDDPDVAADQRALTTFLLRFFLPQVLLYAWGAVATALLYARRRFAITAAAPIGNTIVVVVALVVFRAVAGPDATLDLSLGERLLLALAGTGGVLAFVGVLAVGARRCGFSLRPRRVRGDVQLETLLRHSAWGVLLHANAGLLLGSAIVVGGSVAGGVVAYQVAFVFFLAPYAIFAQPLHTAVLPELSADAARGDLAGFASAVRAALDRMALLVVPVAAAMVALALPVMRVVAFGEADGGGVELLAAALAALAVGLYPYGAFLLLARAYYALDDSRTPAVVAIMSAVLGVAVMIVVSSVTHDAARIAALGVGHSAAYAVGVVLLAVGIEHRTGHRIVSHFLPATIALAGVLAAGAWLASRALDPTGRAETVASLAVIGAVGTGAYVATARRWLRVPKLTGAGT
ncbi:MAG: murein biosynthesis integral membrane protein MurJ [Actinomycetota bacterium]